VTGEDLERALHELPFLAPLRPDEVARAASRFQTQRLAVGQTLELGEAPELCLVLAGSVRIATAPLPGQEAQEDVLRSGDHFGDVALATGRSQPATLTARGGVELARLDVAGLEALSQEFPAIALPVCEAVAHELRFKDSLLRELGEIEALGLTGVALEGALSVRRGRLLDRGLRIARRAAGAVYRETVVARGREPAFWMLVGFLFSIAAARLTVGAILRYHLESHLFALVKGEAGGNPMHLHHFNYGLVLVCAAGLANLFPRARELARFWAALFGVGAGLIFDEWALIWNLDPNYYQPLSLLAAAGVAALLLQLLLFRRFWAAVLRRVWARWAV
jgi:CRP-like cAMP-binding protein